MNSRLVAGVCVLAGCGRLGFDPTAERTTDAPVDVAADAFSVPGLLAFFPFNDDPNDGVDNHATGGPLAACVTTCPVRVPDRRGTGTAYQFNGTTDSIRYPDAPELHSAAGTVAMWVLFARNPSAPDEFMVYASKPYGSGNENSWEMFLYNPSPLVASGGGDSGGNGIYAGTTWTIPANTWVHMALTWGINVRLYINGALVDETGNPGRLYDGTAMYLGSDFDGGGLVAPLEGALDSVYVFSTELPASDIAILASP